VSQSGMKVVAVILLCILVGTACRGEDPGGNTPEASGERPETGGKTTAAPEETTVADELEPAEVTVGPREDTAMPAGGREDDPGQPPPEDPPDGVKTFPATTNRNLSGSIEYARRPPTNGDHAPIWQNCGFYGKPIQDVHAVHSLDHGAVWITYRPNLPADQVDVLRRFARERYVLVSPYPGQPAPVVATAWRNQLRLDSASDPRLRQFVDQFRISETAPRSGNGCTGGVGEPEARL
jgi:Protein of unknown function (DUF3105)